MANVKVPVTFGVRFAEKIGSMHFACKMKMEQLEIVHERTHVSFRANIFILWSIIHLIAYSNYIIIFSSCGIIGNLKHKKQFLCR